MMMNNLFATRLKSLRKEVKMTQDEISKILNIRRSTYGEYERGRIMPSTDKLKAIADYFNVSVDYLLGTTNFPTHEQKASTSASLDIIDISSHMNLLLDQLNNENTAVKFEGTVLNNASKEMLVSNIESILKTLKLLSNK